MTKLRFRLVTAILTALLLVAFASPVAAGNGKGNGGGGTVTTMNCIPVGWC